VFVACSTLCFGKHPLDEALRTITELRFGKVDLAIHEDGRHLKPSEVAANVAHAAHVLKGICAPSLAAFHLHILTADPDEAMHQLQAVLRLARLASVPVVCMSAPPSGTDLERAITLLNEQVRLADGEGVILTVETRIGTLTELPETAIELCHEVPGLALTLDPSHFLVGPARGQSFDHIYRYVRHVRLRDTGAGPHEFQVRVGQGQVDYGRIVNQLERQRYDRVLTVDIRDIPDAPYAMEPEVRKLKYLLESLV
jgi:sugar phosphate isomerase/epimerase